MRVMYVESCGACGCAVVRDGAGFTGPALLAADSCPDHDCECHALLRAQVAAVG